MFWYNVQNKYQFLITILCHKPISSRFIFGSHARKLCSRMYSFSISARAIFLTQKLLYFYRSISNTLNIIIKLLSVLIASK